MNWTSCASAGNPAGECRRGRNPRRAVRRGPGNRSRRGVLGTRDSRDESSAGPLPVRALAWAEPAAGKTPGREQPRRGSTEPNRCYRPAGAMERRPTSKEDGHFAATRGRQCRRTRKALEGTRETPALSIRCRVLSRTATRGVPNSGRTHRRSQTRSSLLGRRGETMSQNGWRSEEVLHARRCKTPGGPAVSRETSRFRRTPNP
jgi:hypothetical protein